MTEFGFAAEKRKSGWFVSPATRENDKILCHDLSGFLGSWEIKEGVFFKSQNNESLDEVVMKEAQEYCVKMNKEA